MKDVSKTVVGLDVHKATIVGAVYGPGSEDVRERFTIAPDKESVAKLVKRLSAKEPVVFVYESGPCGYGLYRQVKELGEECHVITPALTPRKPGDHVKTDRRDAEKLGRYWRSGDLTAIYVPTVEEESARDLVRAREDVLGDRTRARQRVSSFLLRQGRVFSGTTWKKGYWVWLKAQKFEAPYKQEAFESYVRAVEEAEDHLREMGARLLELAEREPYKTRAKYLQALKGIDVLSALTILVETPNFERYESARSYMSYVGMVCREWSTGSRAWRGSITKAGNGHIRRLMVESGWGYRHKSRMSRILMKRREGCPAQVLKIARKAENRLHLKFWRLVNKGKASQKAVVAVGRELAGFVWAISREFPKAA